MLPLGIYGHHWQAEVLLHAFDTTGVHSAWLKTAADKKTYDANTNNVVLLTRQSSKGLEFDTVVLAGLGGLKDDEESREHEVRLLYVGMTRARQRLLLTGSGDNWFIRGLTEGASATRVNQSAGAVKGAG